jgi:hypothetical protein
MGNLVALPKILFQTNPQLTQQMLQQTWDEGLPLQWVTDDSVYEWRVCNEKTIKPSQFCI